MNTAQLQEASRLLREQFPRLLIGKTVDVFRGLSATEREILCTTQNINPPRLLAQNPR